MAELVSIKRNVDVSPGQAAPAVFHCSQGDVGSKIILGLLNNGTAYSIPSGVTVTIEGSESNGSIFTPISATASGSDITFYLTGEMTAVAGPAICQAVLKSGSNILGTANFTLEVESSPMGADAPPVFTDAGWTWMLNKLNTEFVPALGNETIIDAIESKADQSDLETLENTVAGHTGSITVLNNTVNTLNQSVTENRQDIATKLNKNQGTANAGKYLKVGNDGNVTAEETDKTLSIADKAADAKAVGDELTDLKAEISENVGDLKSAFNAAVFGDNVYNTNTFSGNNTAVTNNGDGTFMVGTSDYGRTIFGYPVILKAGLYALYGVPNGESYLSTDGTYSTVIASNKTNAQQYVILDDDTTAYLCYRIQTVPTAAFVIRPFLYNTKIDNIETTQVDLSQHFEAGEIDTVNGKILHYPTHKRMLANKRTGRFLRVIAGTALTATFNGGELYCIVYDASKGFIRTNRVYSGAPINLPLNAGFVKFELDNGSDYQSVVITLAGTEKWEYNNRFSTETIPFGYRVYPSLGTDVPSTDLTYSDPEVFTSGLLMLPPNYQENGEKVPLIYFAHGSGAYNNISEIVFSSNETVMHNIHYLCDEGYAIFDCFGLTDLYGPKGVTGDPMANPTCMAAIRQGIEWVCKNFNVDINSIYVTGKSLGGIPAISMAYEKGLNVKAVCALAPEIDACSVGLGYSVETRKGYADDLGFEPANSPVMEETGIHTLYEFSTDFQNYVRANADKLLGYNPLYKGVLGLDPLEFVNYQILGNQGFGERQELPNKMKTMQRVCQTPTKIIIAEDDPAVSYINASAYIDSLKNGGSIGELRSLPAGCGGHFAVDRAENAPKVSITTKCGVAYTDAPLAYAEMIQFFRRFH